MKEMPSLPLALLSTASNWVNTMGVFKPLICFLDGIYAGAFMLLFFPKSYASLIGEAPNSSEFFLFLLFVRRQPHQSQFLPRLIAAFNTHRLPTAV